MPHRKYSSPRSHRSSSRDRKHKSSSPKHNQHDKQRKPGSKCAQIKQLKALLASLRKEGAAQTSEFINTLLRNPACRTAAQGISTPESAYMAIANQALNDAAQNRESIENSRIASDGSARGWIGNKWYKLKRGVSNNSGKVATALLVAACVALYYMYGPEAIQNATGQAFSSVKEYAAWLAAQPGALLTRLRNYFSGSPLSVSTNVGGASLMSPQQLADQDAARRTQGMSMMTPQQLAEQEGYALTERMLRNATNNLPIGVDEVPAHLKPYATTRYNQLVQKLHTPEGVQQLEGIVRRGAKQAPPLNQSYATPPTSVVSKGVPAQVTSADITARKLANDYWKQSQSKTTSVNDNYFTNAIPAQGRAAFNAAYNQNYDNKYNGSGFTSIAPREDKWNLSGGNSNTANGKATKPVRSALPLRKVSFNNSKPRVRNNIKSPRHNTRTATTKPAKKAVKRSKSPKSKLPKSKRRNNDSIKSSQGMKLRKPT